MPVFQAIAQGLRDFRDLYNRSPKTRAITNTSALYLGINAVGELLGLRSQELEAMCELAAPLVSSVYMGQQLNDNRVVANQLVRDTAKVGLAALVGADLAGTLNGYEGNLGAVNAAKQFYQNADSLLSEKFDYSRGQPTEMTGGLLGAAIGAAQRIMYAYNRLPRRRRRAP